MRKKQGWLHRDKVTQPWDPEQKAWEPAYVPQGISAMIPMKVRGDKEKKTKILQLLFFKACS